MTELESNLKNTYPRLVGDIGGTNARFAVEVGPMQFENIQLFRCEDYPTFEATVAAFKNISGVENFKHALIAIPSMEAEDMTFMVNNPWPAFSKSRMGNTVGIPDCLFVNDFHALALAVPFINPKQFVKLGGLAPKPGKPYLVIGPGTGLGMATVITHPGTKEYFAITAEGGRSSFTAANEEEVELWKFIHKRISHVSVERFVSGPGLQLIFEGLCSINRLPIEHLPTPEHIFEQAFNYNSWIAIRTLDVFCRMLGTIVSNLACFTCSFGGVYIGGGIIPRMIKYITKSAFRSRFEDKGRYRPFLAEIPIYIMTEDTTPNAFYGASYILDNYLKKGYIL